MSLNHISSVGHAAVERATPDVAVKLLADVQRRDSTLLMELNNTVLELMRRVEQLERQAAQRR